MSFSCAGYESVLVLLEGDFFCSCSAIVVKSHRFVMFTGSQASDITYINWLHMARAGLLALEYYSPDTQQWRQAHMQVGQKHGAAVVMALATKAWSS